MNRSLRRSFVTQVWPLPHPKGDFSGKTVLITGANVGLGLEAARHFLRQNASKVILGCRDMAKGDGAKEEILATHPQGAGVLDPDKVEVWSIDLESFDSTKAFCRRAAALDRLDIVVANAGLLSIHHELLPSGHERVITVNVISTWLMAFLLFPVLEATKAKHYTQGEDAPHLVVVGSNAHFYTKFQGQNEASIFEYYKRGEDMFHFYADAKLMSLMVCREVAARMGKGKIVVNMVEPGTCQTQLMREKSWPWYWSFIIKAGFGLIGRTAEMGARTYIAAATAGWESHGIYLEDCGLSTPHSFVDSDEGARVQKRVYQELVDILEAVEPGISGNV